MSKVKAGDLNKLSLLYERYKKILCGFFFRLGNDGEVCEDLVQNVFYRILKYRHLFKGEGDFRTWMFHIARNVNIDHAKKNKIKRKDFVNSAEELCGDQNNRSAEMLREDDMLLLSMAMDRLPADKKEILLLSKYQEKKYSEIGLLLGCTEGAVKVKVFRALQELRVLYLQLEKKM